MTPLELLIAELINDPLNRGYASMTNAEAALDIGSLLYRPGPVPINVLREYFTIQRKNGLPLYGRLEETANTDKKDPFSEGSDLMPEHLIAAKTLQFALQPAFDHFIDVNDQMFIDLLDELSDGQGEVIDSSHKTNILALSSNRKTRSAELGIDTEIGDFDKVREGEIEKARAS